MMPWVELEPALLRQDTVSAGRRRIEDKHRRQLLRLALSAFRSAAPTARSSDSAQAASQSSQPQTDQRKL
jgi:hypothetical protein